MIIWGGWFCFIVFFCCIGFLIVIVVDLVNIFGCFIGLELEVIVIIFVVLGISLFDLFVSKVVFIMEKYVDFVIGNVIGSNLVNVFLGLGLVWVVVLIYWIL